MSSYNFVVMFKVVAHNSRKLTVGNYFCQGPGMQRDVLHEIKLEAGVFVNGEKKSKAFAWPYLAVLLVN